MKGWLAWRGLGLWVLLVLLVFAPWLGRLGSDACCCSPDAAALVSCHCRQDPESGCSSLECATTGLEAVLDNPSASDEEIWVDCPTPPGQAAPQRQERLCPIGTASNPACRQPRSRCPLLLQSELNLPPPLILLV